MIQKSLKLSWLFALALGLSFVFASCEKSDTATSEETIAYTTQAIFDIQERSGCGRGGCFELVFPITIEFPDESTASANDYDELKTIIRDWKEANPDATERPALSFPLEIVSEDGEIVTINSKEELLDVRRECRRNFGGRPHHGRGERCFTLVFPLTLTLPDNSTVEVADRMALKQAVREWRANNNGSMDRPTLTFPLQVKLEDGTIVEVESKEALQDLKNTCSEEG